METRHESQWESSAQTSISERPWRLEVLDTPHLAAHMITERMGYTHHGVYIGGGKVVHYAGLSRVWLARPVEEVSLAEFARGQPVWVQPHTNPRFAHEEIVARAKSRLGEDSYRVVSNNCEHFCEWCVQGESRSRQVEALRRKPKELRNRCVGAVVRWVRRLLSPDCWNNEWAI